jgi:hypothetical protein
MTDRENQLRLDAIAMRYLAAVESQDFDTIDALLEQATRDADLDAMIHALNEAIVADRDDASREAADAAIIAAIKQHLPSAEIISPVSGSLAVSEVADYLRRNPPAGLTADDLKLNDLLLNAADAVPGDLGISRVLEWGKHFGQAPDVYWRAFRAAALKLRMLREADLQLAARSSKPKPPESKP